MATDINKITTFEQALELFNHIANSNEEYLTQEVFYSIIFSHATALMESVLLIPKEHRQIDISVEFLARLLDLFTVTQAFEPVCTAIKDNYQQKLDRETYTNVIEGVATAYIHTIDGETFSEELIKAIEENVKDQMLKYEISKTALQIYAPYLEKRYSAISDSIYLGKNASTFSESAETTLQELESNAWRVAYILQAIRYNEHLVATGKRPHNESMLLKNVNEEQINALIDTYKRMETLSIDLFTYRSFIKVVSHALDAPQLLYSLKRYKPEAIVSLSFLTNDIKAMRNDLAHNHNINAGTKLAFLNKIQTLNIDKELSQSVTERLAVKIANQLKDVETSNIEVVIDGIMPELKERAHLRGGA